MPVIYLGCTKGSYSEGGGVTITVECEDYTPCKLFYRYKHQLQSPRTGNIYVFKGSNGSNRSDGYLTLMANKSYKSACLEKVDVYFNKHENKTPLLFVLHFENGVSNKYYRMSNYTADAKGCKPKRIEDLCKYTDEPSILCDLIQENDALKELLTYDIMQRPNGDGSKCTYNCGKIQVTKNGDGQPKLTDTEFKRYKHTPNNGGHKTKNACIVYNCQALMQEGDRELGDVQGVTYSSVTVYFGEKAKRGCTDKCKAPCAKAATCKPGQGSACPPGQASEGSACPRTPSSGDPQDVPLLLELHKQGSSGDSNNPEYYVHRRKVKNGETGNTDQYYWVKLNGGGTGQDSGLNQLLSDIGLSNQQEGGNGKLKDRLAQTANGGAGPNGKTNNLTLLLKQLEFDLTDSLVILMDKNKTNGVQDGYDDKKIQEAIATLGSEGKNGNINPLKLNNGTKIGVTDAAGQNCLTNRKYRVVQHDFNQAVTKLTSGCSAGLRFLVPAMNNHNNYRELRLYPSDKQTDPANLEYLYYTKNSNGAQNGTKVYVVFYKGTGDGTGDSDPRPLLLCYGKQTYRPNGKNEYEQTWVRVNGVNNCLCNNGGGGDTDEKNKALLGAVTGVVGFLNTVNLYNHPGQSTSKEAGDQACPNSRVSGAPEAATTCQTGSDATTNNTCTYEVDKYNGSDIKVQVKCESVTTTTGSSCYKKLTHQPIGTGTNGAKGFRLGDVAYCSNTGSRGTSSRTGKIDYYGGTNGLASTQNKWAPLKSVWAYFYNDDTKYCDPLLVVLEFAKVTPANGIEKECYRLKSDSGTGLAWQKDEEAKELVGQGDALARHLDGIRYCLKKVIKIELQRNKAGQYPLMGRKANGTGAAGFDQPINGTAGQVTVCEVVPCPALTDSNYKCFRHDLTNALEKHQHEVAGLAFTLPGSGSASVIEIPLDQNGGKGDQVTCPNGSGPANGQTAKITYNKCMGDVCVYFYDGTNSGVKPLTTDTVPLMLQYNGQFYKPETRDKYFDKWVCVPTLASLPGDCGCSVSGPGQHGDGCQTLVEQLNQVNLALNRIDLDPFKGTGYGLPDSQTGGESSVKVDTGTFPTERVKVVTQNAPSTGTQAYSRVVHRTRNGFLIGEIMYNQKEIVEQGITPNGAGGGSEAKIPIANGGKNHKNQVESSQWNTVAVYYSCSDTDKKLPQLIVILKTDTEVTSDQPVTGSSNPNTAYGYYVLSTKNGVSGVSGGSGYAYEWRLVNGVEKPATSVKLDDETDFLLLNSGVILLEQRDKGTGGSGSYGEGEISAAVTSAIRNGSLKESPGNPGQVNRLTGKYIKVTDETSTGDYKCLSGTGFKVMAHCLEELVKLDKSFKGELPTVKLIAGLKLLIPTRNGGGKYQLITLKDNGSEDKGYIKYHQSKNDKIYVFFYGNDPRPLLVCCGEQVYRAKTKDEYFKEWHKAEGVTKCDCTDPPSENSKLLKALVAVSDFLNPVDIKLVPMRSQYCKCYSIHTFDGRKIWIRVSAQPACGSFCFDRYTHTHAGITGKGDGFRLGDIWYGRNCIKETRNGVNTGTAGKCISASDVDDPKTHKSSPEVVVFYYKKDNKHEHPLLVALRQPGQGTTQGQNHKPYFELSAKVGQKEQKKYKKSQNGLDLTETKPDGELAKKLDDILYKISKQLQVILGRRPVATKYSATGAYQKNAETLKPFREAKEKRIHKIAGKAVEEATKAAEKAKAAGRTTGILTDPQAIYSSLTHHVLPTTEYKAQLYERDGSEPVSPPPSNLKITVTEVNCSTIYSQGGYRCFRHLLTTATGIEQVGGLRLVVFDGQGGRGSAAEIVLCTGDNTAGRTQPVELRYTTCKGDIHVF